MAKLGKWMRQARKTLGMTQTEFGEALDLARNHVARMERDELDIRRVTEYAVRYLLVMSKKEKGKRKR
jgi:transcriptional regulator with XRE-family HTH domain